MQEISGVFATLGTAMTKTAQKKKSTAKKRSPKTESATSKPVKAEPPKARAGKAVKADLLRAVKQKVSEHSTELAKALVEKAVAGNSSSASLVFKALDDQIEEEEKSAEQYGGPDGPSPAEQLAKEEPWQEKLENEVPVPGPKPAGGAET